MMRTLQLLLGLTLVGACSENSSTPKDAAPTDLPPTDLAVTVPDADVETDQAVIPPGWVISGGGIDRDETTAVVLLPGGDIVIGGGFSETMTFEGSSYSAPQYADLFVARITPAGKVVWVYTAGASVAARAEALAVDDAGNIVVAGTLTGSATIAGTTVSSAADSDDDLLLFKLSSAGKPLWARTGGGDKLDVGWAVTVDAQGQIYLGGLFESATAQFDSTNLSHPAPGTGWAALIAKYGSDGTLKWVRHLGQGPDSVGALAVTSSGELVVTGRFFGTADFDGKPITATGTLSHDVFLARLGQDGTVQWATAAGGADDDDWVYGLNVATNGTIYITGSFTSTASFGGATLTSKGHADLYVAQYKGDGTPGWGAQIGGPQGEVGAAVVVDAQGTVWVSGGYSSDALQVGSATIAYQGGVGGDVLVAKLTSDGQPITAASAGSTGMDMGEDLVLDGQGNAYVTGHYGAMASFGGETLSHQGDWDFYLWKLALP